LDDAELFARALEALQRRAAHRSVPALQVCALFDRYKAARKRDRSWSILELRLAPFVAAYGDRVVDGLAVIDWTTHAANRRDTRLPGKRGAAGECYSETTISAELGALKAMISWAVVQGLLRFNPLTAARRGSRKRRRTAPKEHEIGLLLAACTIPEHTVMVLGAADVGMRRGEILHLQHDWIDHERKTIALPSYACKGGSGGTVPATQRFLDAVAALPRHFRCPAVLVNHATGQPYKKSRLWEWWRSVRERAGVQPAPGEKSVRLHDGRAAAATNALRRGVPLQTVSRKILRHRHLMTTEVYLRDELEDPAELAAASAAMEAGIERERRLGTGSTRKKEGT
jgi:integrase